LPGNLSQILDTLLFIVYTVHKEEQLVLYEELTIERRTLTDHSALTPLHALLYDRPLPSQGEFEAIYTIMWMT
jgi:hypothetical protein